MDLQTILLWLVGIALGYYVACHWLVAGRAA